MLPAPELTMPATPLFLGDSLSLPEIETLWVNKSETNSMLCKKMKTNNADQGHTNKITKGKLTIALCESWVLSMQVLHGLHNQISSSAHSSVVQGHIEFLGLLEG